MGARCRSIDEILEILRSRTIKRGKCWLYQGRLDRDGYGVIYYNAYPIHIHRFIAHLCFGLDVYEKNKQQANHKAICPNRNCWNPLHIYVGTQDDNLNDAMIKRREKK